MANNKKSVEGPAPSIFFQKELPIIAAAAARQLIPLGKAVVENNPTLARDATNKIIVQELIKSFKNQEYDKIKALYDEATTALAASKSGAVSTGKTVEKTTVFGECTTTTVKKTEATVAWKPEGNTTIPPPLPKPKAGWGAHPRGGSTNTTRGVGWRTFQQQYKPMLKANHPEKSGREVVSELGASWRKLKLHFPNYVERYNSDDSLNPEDDELANAFNKITLIEEKHKKNHKKRRPPAPLPRTMASAKKSRKVSKLFDNEDAPSAVPATLPDEEVFVEEGWAADSIQEKKDELELNLESCLEAFDAPELEVRKPDPDFRKKRIPKPTTAKADTSLDHHIKESMAYCKAARVKAYAPSTYTVAGKTGLLLKKSFYSVINQPTTKMEIIKSEDTLSPQPRYTIQITTPTSTDTVILSVGASLPCSQWPSEARKPKLPRNHNSECRLWSETTSS